MSNRICPQCRTNTDDAVCPVDGFPTVEAAKYGLKAKVDPLIGTTFEERYRIERKLGQGGMGAVYKATQLAVDRPVALKVMNKELGDDLKEVARFQQEARAIASLHHPNVISLIDFGQASTGQLFLVMEFIEGEPLNHLLRRDAPIDAGRAHKMATQIMEALSEAHELGIVHRDMKPENLFVTQLGRRGDFIKVLDFGIAKVRDDQGSDMALTRTGAIIGSPRYMAPEQARGQTITGQTDIYAVGCILYEMLTGKPVFQASSATDYVIAHVTQPPPPMTVDGRALKGPLVDLVMRMLHKKPWDRPQGCEAVLRSLEECRQQPIVVADEEPEPMTGLLVDEPGLPSLPGIAPLESPAVGGLIVPDSPVDFDTSVSRESNGLPSEMLDTRHVAGAGTPPADSKKWLVALAVLLVLAGGAVVAVMLSGGDDKVVVASQSKRAGAAATATVGDPRAPATTQPAPENAPAAAADVNPQKDAASGNVAGGAAEASAPSGGSDEATDTADSPEEVQAGAADAEPVDEGAAPPTEQAPTTSVSVLQPVTVITSPAGARVFIEDVAIGVTPYAANWMVSEDPPELRIEAPRGYVDADVELKASLRGQSLTVEFKKKRRAATKKKKEPAATKKKKKVKWL